MKLSHTHTKTQTQAQTHWKLFVLKFRFFPYITMRNLMRKKLKIHAKWYIFYEQIRSRQLNLYPAQYIVRNESRYMAKHLSVAIQMCHIHRSALLALCVTLKMYCVSSWAWGRRRFFFRSFVSRRSRYPAPEESHMAAFSYAING